MSIFKTLKEVIHDQNLSSLNGLAVAINDVVIPKNKWENRTFSENDKVIIIKATAGG